jgi:hypothetical protein
MAGVHLRPEDPIHGPTHLDARSLERLLADPVSSYYSWPSGRCAVLRPANRRQRLPCGPMCGFIVANREHSFISHSGRCCAALDIRSFPPVAPFLFFPCGRHSFTFALLHYVRSIHIVVSTLPLFSCVYGLLRALFQHCKSPGGYGSLSLSTGTNAWLNVSLTAIIPNTVYQINTYATPRTRPSPSSQL